MAMTIQPMLDEEHRPAAASAMTPDAPNGIRRSIPLRVHTVVRRVPWGTGTIAAEPQPSKAGPR
jgi:hypothetical protein